MPLSTELHFYIMDEHLIYWHHVASSSPTHENLLVCATAQCNKIELSSHWIQICPQ